MEVTMDRLYKLKEVAEILNLAEVTVKLWAGQRKLPVVKVGGRLRVMESELSKWVNARKIPLKK
jgi:excisionase family DNA binding protein